jgi:hypothetical protein
VFTEQRCHHGCQRDQQSTRGLDDRDGRPGDYQASSDTQYDADGVVSEAQENNNAGARTIRVEAP